MTNFNSNIDSLQKSMDQQAKIVISLAIVGVFASFISYQLGYYKGYDEKEKDCIKNAISRINKDKTNYTNEDVRFIIFGENNQKSKN